MSESSIMGYGVLFDDAGRVLLFRRREGEELYPLDWWLPGDVTPITEEPDDTVPRLFEDLLGLWVSSRYALTVTGTEPSTDVHTIHNAYVVTTDSRVDGMSDMERYPFEAWRWWDVEAALPELPDMHAELLSRVVELRESGWQLEDDETLDDLFDDDEPEEPALQHSSIPDRSHKERRDAGAKILAEVTGRENFAAEIESRMGPFGSYLVDHIWGDIWQDGLLSRRDRSLVAMSAAGALMQVDGFAFNAAIGLQNGLSRDEIVEVCVQLTVECGFPYGNLALSRVLADWEQSDDPYRPKTAAEKSDQQRRQIAADVGEILVGRRMGQEQIAEDAVRQLGSLGRLTIDWAWGDVWSRNELSHRNRAMVVLAMHIATGRERELEADLQTAHRLGCDWDELDGVIAIASAFCGLPRASDAARILQRLRTK